MARGIATLGMLPDPADISAQRLGEPISAFLEALLFVEKDKVQTPEYLWYCVVIDRATDYRCKTFV
jgi:hypothetical protein